MLGGVERILPLLRKRLEMAGYDDDELPNIAGEDLAHIFKLIVRDVAWRAEVTLTAVDSDQYLILFPVGRTYQCRKPNLY